MKVYTLLLLVILPIALSNCKTVDKALNPDAITNLTSQPKSVSGQELGGIAPSEGLASSGGTPPAGNLPTPAPCTEGQSCGSQQLSNYLAGQKIDMTIVNKFIGPDPDTMFKSGGSLNIPVINRAAKFLVDSDPAWFLAYFGAQLTTYGLGGSEELSPLYYPLVVGSVMAVLHHAYLIKNDALITLSSQWLTASWAVLALESVKTQIKVANVVHQNGVVPDAPNNQYFNGASVGLAASRIALGGSGASNSNLIFLFNSAINYPGFIYSRSVNFPIDNFPIWMAALWSGVNIVNGKVPNWSNQSPNVFGLTQASRQVLQSFVVSGGTQGLSDILNLIKPFKPACDMTFIRTTLGAESWFGGDSGNQGICNRNKGPHFFASIDLTGTATYLHNDDSHVAIDAYSARSGNQVCATIQTTPPSTKCVPMLGGTKIYEVFWSHATGVNSL